jgi:uncharacterized protein (TIGR03083 family)
MDRKAATEALSGAYGKLTAAVEGLGDAEFMRPSRCAGWTVADVLYHQLLDARRALRTFATPTPLPADTDDVSYWRSFAPGSRDKFAPGGDAAAAHARHVRVVASAYPPKELAWEWKQTAGAACRAATACPYDAVSTQGHVLATGDFIATLAVEAAVHYLDLTVGLPSAPDPDPAALALVRRVLDGLIGQSPPVEWDDASYALKGTGRLPLTTDERSALGSLAGGFPAFG